MGFCQNAWQMIALRGLGGVFAIASVLNLIMVGELVEESIRGRGEFIHFSLRNEWLMERSFLVVLG